MATTGIRDADWIVAYDRGLESHAYASGDVAFCEGTLTHVGGTFAGAAEREIDGRGFMLMPGLVDMA